MKRWKILVPSLVLLAAPASAEILERVVAKVNGDIVTQSEFEMRQVSSVQAAGVPPDQVEAYLRANNARILQEAVDDVLIAQRADELGIKIRSEYVTEIIEGIKKDNKIDSDDALREQLRREGMTLDDLKRNITRSILKRQVLNRELEAKLAVSDAELEAEYRAHLDSDYTRPATVHLQEILVAQDAPGARDLARSLVRRARGGEGFEDLAREYSAAPTRSSGGDLGTLNLRELHSEVQRAAAGLRPGEISDPVPGPDGLRILKLVERSEGGVIPFDEVKADIRKRLADARGTEAYDKFIEGLRQAAVVDIRVREVPLQVSMPSEPSLLDTPLPGLGGTEVPGAPSAGTDTKDAPEIQTSPQTAPQHVVPGGSPAAPPEKKDENAPPPPPNP